MGKRGEMYGLIVVFIGAVCWGTLSLFVKVLEMDAWMFSTLRYLVASAVLLPFAFRGGIPFNKDMVLFVISYVVLGITLVYSIMFTSNAIAIGMQFTAPLWVFIYDYYNGKRLAKKNMLPLAMLLAGLLVYMLTPGEGVTWYGNLLALISGILFGLLTIYSAKVESENAFGMTGIANLVGAVTMFIGYLCFSGSASDFLAVSSTDWILIVLVGVIQTAGGFALFNHGLRFADTQKASVISTMELVSSIIFVAVLLQEYPDVYGLLGSILIIGGIVYQFILASREKSAQNLLKNP